MTGLEFKQYYETEAFKTECIDLNTSWGNHYTKQGTITAMADIVTPTAAEYVFEGPANREVIKFERIDDYVSHHHHHDDILYLDKQL